MLKEEFGMSTAVLPTEQFYYKGKPIETLSRDELFQALHAACADWMKTRIEQIYSTQYNFP